MNSDVEKVVRAAIAYEEAWTTPSGPNRTIYEAFRAQADAHYEIINSVQALRSGRELREVVNPCRDLPN